MEGSGTPIQPSRAPSGGAGTPSAYQGTVTGVRRENGVQTLEIQGAQGRIKLQADGEFQVGEKVRVLVPQGGAVRLEKAALQGTGDWQGVSYTLPGNLATLKGLRAFEEGLVHWVRSRPPGANAPGSNGGVSGGDIETLMRLPLPELLKRVLARDGGRDTLAQALTGLGREAFAALMEGLEEGGPLGGGPADPAKASLLQLLRTLRRETETPARGDASGMPRAPAAMGDSGPRAASKDMGAFWPARPAAASPWGAPADPARAAQASSSSLPALPWMGRVIEREEMGASLAFAGGKLLAPPPPSRGTEGGPLHRYLLDLGGRTLAVQSPQARRPGDLVDFEMETPGTQGGGRLQARFLDPAQTLPPGLRAAHAEATPEGKAALQISARYLSDLRGEPYFDDLVKDFAGVLAQSGRLAPPADGTTPKAGQLPAPKELDTLLRLFVAFPRDAEQPERQAKVWGEAARDPKALQEILKALRPEAETSLLRTATSLRTAGAALPGDPAAPAAAPGGEGDGPEEALAALLRRALPEAFKSPDLLDLARQGAPPGGAEGKEAHAAKFMLQAFAGLMPREDEMREGRPAQFYFYQGQDWRGLQVTWERDKEKQGGRRRDPDAPVKVRVETQAAHMGRVDVGVVLRGDQATLDFRNQFHDVRELLAAEMPELEKTLNLLGVYVEGWIYAQMQDQPNVLPTAGWVRPASLDGGNLDLMG